MSNNKQMPYCKITINTSIRYEEIIKEILVKLQKECIKRGVVLNTVFIERCVKLLDSTVYAAAIETKELLELIEYITIHGGVAKIDNIH